LDAPNLQDDFYLNLIDWSVGNVLAVALHNSVYLWHALSSRVNKLCEVSANDTVSSLVWSQSSNQIAVGTSTGTVQIWDANKSKIVRCLTGHTARVGSMSWNNNHILSSGSKDKMILNRDTRDPSRFTDRLIAHKQ
jgi:cell division cycle 20-like protein 1 (cofactor of APC complex)